jgi:hypothetical protein
LFGKLLQPAASPVAVPDREETGSSLAALPENVPASIRKFAPGDILYQRRNDTGYFI